METINQDVINSKGKKVGSVQLDGRVFGARVYTDLLHQAVRWQRAKKRAGTHSVLTRSNMKGGGKKPFKQKGTGNARAGSIISPLWVGGAVVHGPTPRSYEFGMPRKVRQKALSSALSEKLANGALLIIDSLEVASGKTRDMSELLKGLGFENKKILLVVSDSDSPENQLTLRATKNISGVNTVPVIGLNVYDLVNSQVVIMTQTALDGLNSRLIGGQDAN